MSSRDAESVVRFLRDIAGDNLRAVAQYDATDSRRLYLREDLSAAYDDQELDEIVAGLRAEDPQTDAIREMEEAGSLHCTVRLYDRSVTVHVKQRADFGTIVSLDPSAAGQLTSFVSELMRVLDRHSPQQFEDAPAWMQKE